VEQSATEAEREAADRDAALNSVAARREREQSRTAFRDLSAEQAVGLLVGRFGKVFAAYGSNQLDRPGVRVQRYLGDFSARILTDGSRESRLVSSWAPLQAENEQGDSEPVDLDLREAPGAFSPKNPVVDTQLPKQLADGIALGKDGLRVGFDTGREPGAPLADRHVFYGNTGLDTDLVITPVEVGLEAFWQLRSDRSPEVQTIRLALPAGAMLNASADGGAEVRVGSDVLLAVPAPTAVDAEGRAIPVTMNVIGPSVIEVRVDHRARDLSYPLLVDPVMDAWRFSQGQDLGAVTVDVPPSPTADWFWHADPLDDNLYARRVTCYSPVSCYAPSGPYIYGRPGTIFPGATSGGWYYKPPGGGASYIASASLGPVWYQRRSDTAADPYLYAGLYSDKATQWVALQTFPSGDLAAATLQLSAGTRTDANTLSFGMHSRVSRTLGDWRDAYLGGATVTIDDTDHPHIVELGGVPPHWIRGGSQSISVTASDSGLGVRRLRVNRIVGATDVDVQEQVQACTGTRRAPCPAQWTQTFLIDADAIPEGTTPFQARTFDALDKGSVSEFSLKVDRSAPSVQLGGYLYDERNLRTDDDNDWDKGAISSDAALTVKAVDGSSTATRSGVASVEVLVDGDRVQSEHLYRVPGCSVAGCPQEAEVAFSIARSSVANGDHDISVVVRDQVADPEGRQPGPHIAVRSFRVRFRSEASVPESQVGTLPPDGSTMTAATTSESGDDVVYDGLEDSLVSLTDVAHAKALIDRLAQDSSSEVHALLGGQPFTYDEFGALTQGVGPDGQPQPIGVVAWVSLSVPRQDVHSIVTELLEWPDTGVLVPYQADVGAAELRDAMITVDVRENRLLAIEPGPTSDAEVFDVRPDQGVLPPLPEDGGPEDD
jgi:hypothetical protein